MVYLIERPLAPEVEYILPASLMQLVIMVDLLPHVLYSWKRRYPVLKSHCRDSRDVG